MVWFSCCDGDVIPYGIIHSMGDVLVTIDLSQKTDAELVALKKLTLAAIAQKEDTPLSFAAFFELMHEIPLHSEGEKWIANAYQAHEEKKGLAQEVHREGGKTTVFSKFFLAYRIGKEPEKCNMVVRINDKKAKETSDAVAHIIEFDPKWKMVFPNVVPDKIKGWGQSGYEVMRSDMEYTEWSEVKTKNPSYPTFVGYGWESGSIIGSRLNGVLVVDDIHDEGNTRSDRMLTSVKKFYKETLFFILMENAWEIWNFTPWTENDVYAYLKSTGRYIHSKTPVMVKAKKGEGTYWEPNPLIPISGQWYHLYHPEKWTFPRLEKSYDIAGTVGFSRMMMLDLEATKGLDLKKSWLHEYPASDILPSWPVLMGIDYASTADKLKDKDRDFFTIAVMRAIPGGGLVLIDGYRGHLSKGEGLAQTVAMAGIYPTLQIVGVENIGKGEEFYNDLVLTNDTYGNPLPLMPIKHGRASKGDRFENWLGPRFEMTRIWISNVHTPFLTEFVNEWLTYPRAKHDDCLDAVYMAAFAGEGFMPTKAERSFKKRRNTNPYSIGNNNGNGQRITTIG